MNSKLQQFFNVLAQTSLGRKSIITAFYLALLAAFLYVSLVKDYFFPAQELYVYTFVDMLHPKSIAAFEQAHNVKVVLRYFESNEELLAKFMINRGVGYDVIITSDYMVEFLSKDNLLHKLDHAQLPVRHELDERLLGKYYDVENEFSLPFSWIPYGIIFHKGLFAQQPETISLSLLFDDPKTRSQGVLKPYRICMADDSREAISLASLYLFGDVAFWTEERLRKIEALLINQKRWVESYVNQDLAYPLFSGLIKVAMAPLFAAYKVLKTSQDFSFMLPEEGSVYSIENLAISRSCKRVDLAHKFINFMLSRQEAARMSNRCGMHPSNKTAYTLLRPNIVNNKHTFPDNETFAKLHLLSNDVPLKAFEEVWLAVKSS